MSDSSRGRGRLVADRRYPRKPAKPAQKSKPAKARRKVARKPVRRGGIIGFFTGIIRWIFRLVFRLTVFATTVCAIILAAAVWYVASGLPDHQSIVDGRAKGSVTLLDRDGNIFATRGDQFGGVVTAQSVSPHLRNAVVATEDKRFYRHLGVSPRGIASAVRINMSEGRGPLSGHGGSTITQQTAKLLCLGVAYDPADWKSEADYVADCRRGSLQRKAYEAIYALAMEVRYSKDEILTIYLNRAYMGAGAYGAEAAAQRYFAKPAAALDPAEAAMIAGLLTAPTRLAPTTNLKRSQDRAATVLRLMQEQGYLTEAETRQYQNTPAVLNEAQVNPDGGYFADWVIRSLGGGSDRDAEAEADRTSFDADILRALEEAQRDRIIETTLDPRIQRAAAEAVDQIFAQKVKEGSKAQVAVVVMSADGAVRGMVGGRDTNASGVFNRATQAVRQTGSAFKPFVYATALELGYSPLDTVVDERFCMTIPGSGQWCPENYTNEFEGRVTLTDALKKSLNIPAVRVSESVGRDLVHKVAYDFGIESDLADTPALALGASEASLLEMTGAFAGFLNGGSAVQPYGIKGQEGTGIQERVISPQAAGQMVWMMEKVVSEGTARRAALPDRAAAGKTGTSQEARDAWFIGFTADYVAGVWMGYDDNSPLTGVTGGGLPAEIWHEVMVRVHEGLPPRGLPMIAPTPKAQPAAPEPAPAPAPAPQPRRVNAETVLQQVLRDILGGGN
jgi:membrane peptidoglycan carboxypeptidase